MLTLVFFYASLAIAREALAVLYYRVITANSAILASIVNFGIELLDIFVISTIVVILMQSGNIWPLLIYALFGSFGVFLGVRLKKKNDNH